MKKSFTVIEDCSPCPIGVFDSGYGGLTVLKDMVRLLPEYDYLYLGDNARAPYGPLPFDTVYAYTLAAVKWFFERGAKLVILACNTASAKALRSIQQNDLPVLAPAGRILGVIRPTSEVIGRYTKTGHIGVLGTQGTVLSGSYLLEIEKFFPELTVTQEACNEWVDLVEDGLATSAEADGPVKEHTDALMRKDPKIDTVLLACTHYPLLTDKIKAALPPGTDVIAQGEIVAKSLKAYLVNHPETAAACSKNENRRFYTTGDPANFDEKASVFFEAPVNSKKAFLLP